MSGYKDKHANDLRLGQRIRNVAVMLPLAATLTMGCNKQKPSSVAENSVLLTKDSIFGEDLYGYPVTLKHVRIRTYSTAEVEPTDTYLLQWGTPKEELPNVYKGEKTYVKGVNLDDNDCVYIEVFKNKYGIEISKDQPCFMINLQNHLAYIGDEASYFGNLKKYAHINKLIPADQEEKIIIDERSHKVIRVPVVAQPVDTQTIQAMPDSIIDKSDSLTTENTPDSIRKLSPIDTLVMDTIIPDTLLHNQETR